MASSFTLKTQRGTTNTIVQGMPEVIARLGEIADAAQDIAPAWKDIAALFAARQDAVFSSNGFGRWAPRAPSTIKEGIGPLQETGIMREGVSGRAPIWSSKQAAAFGAPKADRRVMNVAVLNTVGHKRGTKDVPARVVVPPLRAAEKRAWIKAIEEHITRALS